MSNSNGGSNRLGLGGLKIPESVRKTIQDIKEITGKQHDDEDIYAVLRECHMDPNDTAQKLLYLDTFHEVKRKSDRRKVTPSTQGRGTRGNRSYHSGNNVIQPIENGVNNMKERGNGTSFRAGQKKNNGVFSSTSTGSSSLPNGTSSLRRGSKLSVGGINSIGESSAPDARKVGGPTSAVAPIQIKNQGKSSNTDPPPTASVPSVYLAVSDPILAPSNAWNRDYLGTIKRELVSEQKTAEQNHGNTHVNGDLVSDSSGNEQMQSGSLNSNMKEKDLGSRASVKNHSTDSLETSSLSAHVESLDISSSNYVGSSAEEMVAPLKEIPSEDAKSESRAQLLHQSTVPNGHVTFPAHLKVPEALKNGFTFGSFDGNDCDTTAPATEKNITAEEPLSSDQNVLSSVQADSSDQSESPKQLMEKLPESGANVISDADMNQLNLEVALLPDGQENSTVPIAPNYEFEMMPPTERGQLVQLEGQETEAQDASRLSSFVGDNLTTLPQTLAMQNPVAASPQPLLFRSPYHPNFLPYGHYYNPYFLPPYHPYLSPNGLPQQSTTGNTYLTPAATASGVKFPLPQFKPGTNGANPSLYGSYGLSPVGFNPGPALTSTTNSEDISATQLKESQGYTTGATSEVSAWIPQGHEMSSLQLNSFYHISPQGQHLSFSSPQTGHSPFPGIYPPMPTITAALASNPTLQHSQPMSVSTETVVPPSAAFQQPQLAQMNWNSSY